MIAEKTLVFEARLIIAPPKVRWSVGGGGASGTVGASVEDN